MIDWKWHVTTLVAVFLALAIGIVVGSIVGDRTVLTQQSSILNQLEGDLLALREANLRLRAEAEQARSALKDVRTLHEEVFPAILAGRLRGVNVALVSIGCAVPAAVKETLALAGAKVTSLTELDVARVSWPSVTSFLGVKAGVLPDRMAGVMGRLLAEAIARGGEENEALMELGVQQGWLRYEGRYGEQAALVIIDGSTKAQQRAAAALVLSLGRYWRRTCGSVVVATLDNSTGSETCKELGVVTVRGLTEPWGRAALVSALARAS